MPFHRGIPSGEGVTQPHPPLTFTPTHGWVSLSKLYFSTLISAGASAEFDFTVKEPRDPLPSLMSQYRTARSAVAGLQAEKQTLQLQLRSLQNQLSLHKLHVRSACQTKKEAKRRTDANRERLRLLEERRKVLIDSHFASVRGSHAGEYRALMAENVRLEDQFRQIAASHMVTRYSLQKLFIDVAHAHNEITLQTVCMELPSTPPPPTSFFRLVPAMDSLQWVHSSSVTCLFYLVFTVSPRHP